MRKLCRFLTDAEKVKGGVHYGLFLLGYQAGLRVNEAVKFDLAGKSKQGLYRIEKPKGKKERFVYIPKKIIKELKKQNWQPNQTNRWNFYHFLRKIKRELNISKSTELTPHSLRRAFATYQAEKGMPLPLLQKLLGHSSIRTTALYWRNIYQEPDNGDIGSILAGKNWLEDKNNEPKLPSTENFPELPKIPKPIILLDNPKPTTRPIIKETPSLFIKQKPTIQPKPHESKILTKIADQQSINSQQLNLITNQGEPPTKKEAILLTKIKLLEEQLKKTQELAKKEKKRAEQAEQQLRKIGYYQQLGQEQKEITAQIIQPPPLKIK